ncbi:cysteine hydrolase family protein [Evansella cellulosilytica]|uniref:Isochorismatase hydrolase n=1 Tax=Evansella cellulosilytica (strain ATCC 21833 / DSM 2522 / FERM P-1141 / JCM 9156 / N-4) TaxID=649639 RepID=E6TRY0_EVAC2|nr:cysteine hydrolase [Evansella cellulosilytica]ADU29503.1 isochorismatase hydrolase [Evansella cellulosilytica DSM 2522]
MYDPMVLSTVKQAALVVIDMQNDFVADRGAFAQAGFNVKKYQALESTIVNMLSFARAQLMPVIFVQMVHNDENDGNGAWVQRRKEKQHPNSCREGTWGVEWYGKIRPSEKDYIVRKHRYTAFINPEFDSLLKSLSIETLIVTGINTNTCVESTVRDAHHRDYHVVVVKDATTCAFEDAYEPSLQNIERHFGAVITSEEWYSYFLSNEEKVESS